MMEFDVVVTDENGNVNKRIDMEVGDDGMNDGFYILLYNLEVGETITMVRKG